MAIRGQNRQALAAAVTCAVLGGTLAALYLPGPARPLADVARRDTGREWPFSAEPCSATS